MKYFLSAFSLALLFCYSGCTDDDDTQAPIDQLPPFTTAGENTFGCLVNGEALVVTNTSKISAIYQGGFLQFGGEKDDNGITRSLRFVVDDPLVLDQSYSLGESQSHRSRYRTRAEIPICYYEYEDTYEGFLAFSKIDQTNFIISGSFEFATVTNNCDTIRITDGRFDMQYVP